MPRNDSNILELVFSRDPELSGKDGQATAELEAAPEDEIRAIASCLEYLYGESMRLGQKLPAHLIGAAAESLRQELAHAEDPAGNRGAS